MLLITEALWHGIVGGISFALFSLVYYGFKGLSRFANRPSKKRRWYTQNVDKDNRLDTNQKKETDH